MLKREGGSHSLWLNPATGAVEAVPRHTEIANVLAKKIAEPPLDCIRSCRQRTRLVHLRRVSITLGTMSLSRQ
jgi:hypothetical protein